MKKSKMALKRFSVGLTQIELARLVGVGGSTLAQYELGYRAPSQEIMEKIAFALGVKIGTVKGWWI